MVRLRNRKVASPQREASNKDESQTIKRTRSMAAVIAEAHPSRQQVANDLQGVDMHPEADGKTLQHTSRALGQELLFSPEQRSAASPIASPRDATGREGGAAEMSSPESDSASEGAGQGEDAELLACLTEGLFGSLRPGFRIAGGAAVQQAAQPQRQRSLPADSEDELEEVRWEPQLALPQPDEHAELQQQLPPAAAQPAARATAAGKTPPETAGASWYGLPAQTLTPQLKRDLQLLRLRGAFDPKRHYKTPDGKKLPKHFHIGMVVEPAAEFYSGRLTNKQRKRTLTEELLADPALAASRKRRFMQLQEEAGYWASRKKRKTSNLRLTRRPGHARHKR